MVTFDNRVRHAEADERQQKKAHLSMLAYVTEYTTWYVYSSYYAFTGSRSDTPVLQNPYIYRDGASYLFVMILLLY
jgi:hypothetical protein